MKKVIIICFISSLTLVAFGQTSVADGKWINGATWGGSSPGYTNLQTPTVDSYVISDASLVFADANSRKLYVYDTLIVYGDVTFDDGKSNAVFNIGPNNLVIIFGNLHLGKNHAGADIGDGGMLIVTGNISASGTGGDFTGAGTVFTDGTTSGMTGGNAGGEHPINQINETEGDSKSPIEEFVLGGGEVGLPVELLYFRGKQADGVQLEWATATEKDNDKFEVQRSSDGRVFEIIGEVKGNGTYSGLLEYSFVDLSLVNQVSFYRLKQIDFDGQFEYSPVIRVETKSSNPGESYMLYPTITNGHIIKINAHKSFDLRELSVYDINGAEYSVTMTKNHQSEYIVNLSGLTKGAYFLKGSTVTGDQITKRFFVK
ncbi:MAG: T9SS type A sorting domain-containing protein [Marinoscillum sp.]